MKQLHWPGSVETRWKEVYKPRKRHVVNGAAVWFALHLVWIATDWEAEGVFPLSGFKLQLLLFVTDRLKIKFSELVCTANFMLYFSSFFPPLFIILIHKSLPQLKVFQLLLRIIQVSSSITVWIYPGASCISVFVFDLNAYLPHCMSAWYFSPSVKVWFAICKGILF